MAEKRFEQNKTRIRSNNTTAVAPRKKKRRRTAVARAVLVVTVLAVAAVGVALSLTVFFKIKSIDVYGETAGYSSKQIISAGKIRLESNLIRLDSDAVSKRIETALPCIESVKIVKKLPTTVELRIFPAEPAGYIKTKGEYAVISMKGKILRINKEADPSLAEIKGPKVQNLGVSAFVSDKSGMLKNLSTIYSAAGTALSKNITYADVSDRIDISFVYRDRITVMLGSESELAEKLKFVSRILSDPEKISEDDIGIIYASNPKKISYLRKGKYVETVQSQQEVSSAGSDSSDSGSSQESDAESKKTVDSSSQTSSLRTNSR